MDKIWNFNGPQRIKNFLWLASDGKLLMNVEGRKLHVADQVCGKGLDTTTHAPRDCTLGCSNLEQIGPFINHMPSAAWLCGNLLNQRNAWANDRWCTKPLKIKKHIAGW
ncbi:hypothetical protein GOBAR_AA22739 [Gossypium barbadense]|uniref:Reverse transcriptase zinc-binding domain-containing protein n=1 Tax=Gossypium barbadense TaxID=3634 RepID=A0A2P5X3J3_GOSBA|nr:hypothetical protein GOBAR_AA22739 [Gossypium barbadense]